MEDSQPKQTSSQGQEVDHDELQQLKLSLPKDEWFNSPLHFYQGFWCPTSLIFKEISAFQNHFQANDTDVILASIPKSGTTWLKSLLYIVANRKNLSYIAQHTLQSKNPHELVNHLEYQVYRAIKPDLTNIPSPRLFATHLPYSTLPESIKTSNCRIVYVGRNPLDNFISVCHFWLLFDTNKDNKADVETLMKQHLQKYCKGVFPHGPYEDHLLDYWKESIKNPQKVLFLEYEGLKKEPRAHLIKLAEFVGYPFSEEEKDNVVDEIIELCSLKSLKKMEVNQSGKFYPWFENKTLFRKGEIGDWTNHLTPSMAKCFDEILEKLKIAGFSFTYYQPNL